MQIENWERVSRLFDDAMARPADTREAFITRQADNDQQAEQVLRLVRAAEHETGFLATSENGAPVSRAPLAQGTRLGNWQIKDRIGAGGMGEVYLVKRADGLYDQIAALKLIASSDPNVRDRFATERQVLANLEHPGIGRLIDGGVAEDGRPFFVMEHVDGIPIDAYVSQHKLSQHQTLELFLTVCEALAHAHGRFVLHRDIKPGNILVSEDGHARLIDFGVAALITDEIDDLSAPMTLRYAAPEQLSGQVVSVATDVFGLGATLHELLTGHHPTRQGYGVQLDADHLPRQLQAILTKALADKPADRYGSTSALCSDIENYLHHRPVEAVPASGAYRLGLFLRRNALGTAAVAAVILALGIGLAGTIWQADRARAERDTAFAQRDRLEAMQQAAFLLLAETGDLRDNETTQDVVARSAERILKEFEENPEDAAPTLHMYGELFFLMNDYPAAEPLLRAVADMDAALIGEELKARAQIDLASVLIRSGDPDEARTYFAPGKAFFAENAETYPDEHLDNVFLETQFLNEAGKTEEALALLEETLPRRMAYSGRNTMDTAQFYTNIGVARMRTGDLPGAIEASENARDIFRALDRLESPDGLNTMNNLASLYHVTGQTELADAAYSETLDMRRSLFGGSAATAVLMSNYAKLRLANGDSDGAMALLAEAVPMADRYAGPDSPPAFAARFGQVEALILSDDLAAARTLLEETEEKIEANAMWSSPYGGMQHLYSGQLQVAEGKRQQAMAALDKAQATFEAIGPAAARYLAKVEAIRETL